MTDDLSGLSRNRSDMLPVPVRRTTNSLPEAESANGLATVSPTGDELTLEC
jgi:hypothetical protein